MDEKNCFNCKHFDKEEYELPCRICKNNFSPLAEEYSSSVFQWEAKDKVSEPDSVNHPSHYCQDGSMEAIDEMIAVFGVEAVKNFCLLNVWKYRKRAIFKNGEEDLKKSDWYMKKFVELNGRG
jgi:hypothetical protein